jgi:hypothetical protein
LQTIVATLILAPQLALLLYLSAAVPFGAALAAMSALVSVVMLAGSLILRAARAAEMPAPAAWVLGVAATALALYGLVACFHLLAASAFALWAGLVLLATIGVRRRWGAVRRVVGAHAAAALFLCGAATLFWCWQLAEVPAVLARDGVLSTWVDQFIHGSVISQFGDARAPAHTSMELAGVASLPYHFASYMLPAALARPLDLPGLTLATSVWVPLGFFTVCAGAYALGFALAGAAGGLAALGSLTLLPDAASYGLYNRLFGYYWYVLAVPTASYAVGIALLAIAFLKRWLDERSRHALVAGGALVVACALVRFHVFLLLLPAWTACAALAIPLVRRRWLGCAAGALALLGVFVWGFYRVSPDTPHALELFLDVAHNQQQPVAYWGLYGGLTALYGPQVAVPIGVLLVLLATLGMFALFYPLSLFSLRRARALQAIDALPLALLACYLALILTAPVPSHGDATEFTQRPFVLVYAVFAVWTAAGLASWITLHGGIGQRRVWLPLVIAGAALVMWTLRYTVGDWRWAYAYRVAQGLPQAAAFVRARALPGDVLAANDLHPSLVTTDVAVQLASLTGVPAYLARPFTQLSGGGERAHIALQRYIALRGVERESSVERARARLHALGIRWYVVAESDRRGPRWDPERKDASFVERMVAVYEVK